MKSRLLLPFLAASAICPCTARADQKADALIQQVQDAADKAIPIQADYTVTFRDEKGVLVTYQHSIKWSENRIAHSLSSQPGKLKPTDLPPETVDLFDPFLDNYGYTPVDPSGKTPAKPSAPPVTHYLGTVKVNNVSYQVVQTTYALSAWATTTQKWYIGTDQRIDRMTGRVDIKLLPNPSGHKIRTVTVEGVVTDYKRPQPEPSEPAKP